MLTGSDYILATFGDIFQNLQQHNHYEYYCRFLCHGKIIHNVLFIMCKYVKKKMQFNDLLQILTSALN